MAGGHTLGQADGAWEGQWTEGLEIFALNNRYFTNMLRNNWTQVRKPFTFLSSRV